MVTGYLGTVHRDEDGCFGRNIADLGACGSVEASRPWRPYVAHTVTRPLSCS